MSRPLLTVHYVLPDNEIYNCALMVALSVYMTAVDWHSSVFSRSATIMIALGNF